jgi:excisionase family DNA binding protein
MAVIEMPQKASPREPVFISVAEAAAMIGVSKYTAKRWIRLGTIASVKVGGRRLVAVEAIDQMVARAMQSTHRTDDADGK